jgi:S-adenosylmethionine-diacylglycerol 3-amino-3-carboxypropyl transferase
VCSSDLDDAEIAALWQAIDHAGADDIRVIFRTAGAESPLDQPALAALQSKWRRDEAQSALGFAADRSGIYGGFHLYRRR